MLSTLSAPRPALEQAAALQQFFAQYPDFDYDPEESPPREFDRMCNAFEWRGLHRPEKNAAREAFHTAMKDDFKTLYGSDEKDIRNWKKLCHVLRIEPAPETLSACRKAVVKKYVNLVDLVQAPTRPVHLFPTEKELSDYTKRTKKFFPREEARDGGVLRALRRQIHNPGESHPPHDGQQRRGKKVKGTKASTAIA
ncbi:hypothetical protein BC834DRAFT_827594 [Gloeopeniophorella convolvens]|nr:hypothetical protein BC834DRAFT_827594 [Gloeopeniophorella convolvens]